MSQWRADTRASGIIADTSAAYTLSSGGESKISIVVILHYDNKIVIAGGECFRKKSNNHMYEYTLISTAQNEAWWAKRRRGMHGISIEGQQFGDLITMWWWVVVVDFLPVYLRGNCRHPAFDGQHLMPLLVEVCNYCRYSSSSLCVYTHNTLHHVQLNRKQEKNEPRKSRIVGYCHYTAYAK